jgi:hypothetical protein
MAGAPDGEAGLPRGMRFRIEGRELREDGRVVATYAGD